jgi:hypothetical protein
VTHQYGGKHNPQGNGMCEHRWANRVRRTVHCGYAEGYAAALAGFLRLNRVYSGGKVTIDADAFDALVLMDEALA